MAHTFLVQFGIVGNGAPNEGKGRTMRQAFDAAKASNVQAIAAEYQGKFEEFFIHCQGEMRSKRYASCTLEHTAPWLTIRHLQRSGFVMVPESAKGLSNGDD